MEIKDARLMNIVVTYSLFFFTTKEFWVGIRYKQGVLKVWSSNARMNLVASQRHEVAC